MDWNIIAVAVIAALPGLLAGIATLVQGMKIHSTFNSKMDKMLEVVSDAAFARGVKQEKDAQLVQKAEAITENKTTP